MGVGSAHTQNEMVNDIAACDSGQKRAADGIYVTHFAVWRECDGEVNREPNRIRLYVLQFSIRVAS